MPLVEVHAVQHDRQPDSGETVNNVGVDIRVGAEGQQDECGVSDDSAPEARVSQFPVHGYCNECTRGF